MCCTWFFRWWELKCATLSCSLIVCICLCIQFTAHQTHTAGRPAVYWDTKSPPSKPLLPLESHAFTTPLHTSLHPLLFSAILQCFESHDSTWPDKPQSCSAPVSQLATQRVCINADVYDSELLKLLNEAVWVAPVVWPYSAVQRCSWPGAACWPLSSSRPWGPVSCGCLRCAEPARRRRWWGSGPACWNSAACRTARPAPGHHSKTKHRFVRYVTAWENPSLTLHHSHVWENGSSRDSCFNLPILILAENIHR